MSISVGYSWRFLPPLWDDIDIYDPPFYHNFIFLTPILWDSYFDPNFHRNWVLAQDFDLFDHSFLNFPIFLDLIFVLAMSTPT